jgi:EAL domain-containing protein (putative c-di-GMP-specific phosphodiesterase class I)/GGDEF domain-containing protein
LHDPLERMVRRKVFESARKLDGSHLIFVNTSPPVFTDDRFAETVREEIESFEGLSPHRVVIEITERTPQGCTAPFSLQALSLRELGFGVALDDVGAGISGLNQIMSLRPNWIKLDISLVADIDFDPLKQNLIRFFVHFAQLGNMRLVAEGIERLEQLRMLVNLGVSHGQGYLLGRPGGLGSDVRPSVRTRLLDLRHHYDARKLLEPSLLRIDSLATPAVTCDVADSIEQVRARLSASPAVPGLVVLDGRRFIGWLAWEELATQPDARDHDAVGGLRLVDGPLVGASTSVPEALEILASRPNDTAPSPLIVQINGLVHGIVQQRQVLLAAAEMHRRAPSHVAPLTGLPSRVQADRWLASRIRSGDSSDLAFVDLREFNAYNFAYGFERGDQMLIRLVGMIKSELVDVDGGASFFAHLGGDRFMLAFPVDARDRLLRLMESFEAAHGEFFSAADVSAGAFESTDAAGGTESYPLTTLRVIYLPCALRSAAEPRDLHFIAGRLSLRSFQEGRSRREIITDRREPARVPAAAGGQAIADRAAPPG